MEPIIAAHMETTSSRSSVKETEVDKTEEYERIIEDGSDIFDYIHRRTQNTEE